MKNMKRALSWFLAVCMILTCLSTNAYATEDPTSDDTTAPIESVETVTPDDSTADEAAAEENVVADDEEETVADDEVETVADDEEEAVADDEEEAVVDEEEITSITAESVESEEEANNDGLTLESTSGGTGGTLDTSEFATMVLIDCGRGYYSVDNIKSIIDTMSANYYKYLMLGFGNDGLRFVLDDMSVTVGNTTYDSSTVKNAVISANDTLQNNNGNGQWTQSQMDDIISYAESKGIGIVPMLNCPGHAYSMYQAVAAATGITDCYTAYGTSGTNKYNYSIDLSDETVKGFVEGLVEKYISYFDKKGCKFFNFGCDETKYAASQTVTYLNDVCATMPDTMVPMAFCDILKNASGYPSNLVGIDWDGGNLGSSHYHFNANDNWYYVLGTSETSDGWSSYYRSINRTKTIDVTTTIGGEKAYGSILAVWNDSYLASDDYIDNIQNLIISQSGYSKNATYFPRNSSSSTTDSTATASQKSETATETALKVITVAVGGTYTDTLTGSQTKTTDSDTSIATVATEEKEVAGTWSASASASIGAYTSDYTADNLIDGSTSSYYWSGSAQSVGAYARVDFGTDQTINAVRISPSSSGSDDNTCTANVQISADGTNWTTVGTYTGTQKVITFDSQTARYAQVVLTASSTKWWQLGEIEWGTATTSGSTEDTYNGQSVTLSKNNYSSYIGYYYKSGNAYYQITNITRTNNSGGSSGTYTISYNGTSTSVQSSTSITLYTKTSGSSTTTFTPCDKSGSGESTTNTVVTIKGVAVGETTAVVGTTTYNILVQAEDVSNVTLTYYPFLSDYPVYEEGTGASSCGAECSTNAQTLNASTAGVNTENGVDISTIAWAEGDWLWEGDTVQTVYWKGVLHDSSNIQAGVASDKSLNGTDFTYVRYYNGTWSVSADRETWTDIESSDEVCVYYLQQTEITDEVTTYVKDWAFTTADTSSWYSKDHKALSFSVVYPDGQMSPTADSIYSDSTLIYWYDTGSKSESPTMMIRVGVNDVYKVSKITWTLGTMTNPTTSSRTDGSLTWNMTTDADGNEWYDETTYWTPAVSDDPVVKTSDFCGGYGDYYHNSYNTANSALLILIYLEPVQTEDSLTVRYVDDSSNTEFMNYPVNVTNIATEEKGTFLNRLKQTSAVNVGEFTLDDDAYVTNAKGTNETFQKTLTKIPALSGTSYASGLYEYVKAEISEDGKTMTLHYNLKSDIESTDYVIDFGLGIDIPISDLKDVDTTGATVTVGGENYGVTAISGSTITYTPDEVLTGTDVFNVYLKYSDKTLTKTIKVYPATTVFYEEGFASYTGTWTSKGSKGSGTQTKQKAGSSSDEYGFDAKYSGEETGASNKTAATTSTKASIATFSFKGTGVDIYANCKEASGVVVVRIKNSKGNYVKSAIVDTSSNQAITKIAAAGKEEYSLPIVSLTELDYDEYSAEIRYASEVETASFSFDGFRVYGTLETEPDFYENYDLEDNPDYVELRNEVLVASGITKGTDTKAQVAAVLTLTGDDAGAVVISDESKMSTEYANELLSNGPKNELFLASGESVVFNVNTKREVQLGMKAVTDSVTVSGSYNGTISSSTDMFYKVKEQGTSGQTITITNNGDGILSITKVKVCDDPNFTFGTLTESDLDDALMDLGLKEDTRKPSTEVTTEDTTPTEPSTEAPTQPTITEQKGQTQPAATTAQKPTTKKKAVAIKTQPKGTKVKKNKKASFTVKATGYNLTYQWQVKKNKKWVNVSYSGSKTATMKVKAKKSLNKKKFRCVVKDGYGNVVTTKAVTLKVK